MRVSRRVVVTTSADLSVTKTVVNNATAINRVALAQIRARETAQGRQAPLKTNLRLSAGIAVAPRPAKFTGTARR